MNSENVAPITEEIEKFNAIQDENNQSSKELLANFENEVSQTFPEDDASIIKDALLLMSTLHMEQKRANNELYINHLLSVADKVIEFTADQPDKDLVIAALLHDSVEDQGDKLAKLSGSDEPEQTAALGEIRQKYGDRVGNTVELLTNPDFDNILLQKEIKKSDPSFAELRRNLYANHVREAIENPDVLIVKLADFCDNVLNLERLPVSTPSETRRKNNLHAKYLPVMKIFAEKLEQTGQFPTIRESLEQAYNNATEA